MFHLLAPIYDEIYATKDYRAEVDRLEELVRRFGPPDSRSWLDVGCGTGRHLALLRKRHAVTGVDASRAMLRIARQRLRGVPLQVGDMRTFRLGKRFDVVTCLFSAIGHLSTERDVARTFVSFARHLNPGGVAIVEPWIDPTDFRPGSLHLVTRTSKERILARLAHSRRKGPHSLVHFHYLIGEPSRGVRYLEEIDVGLLVPRRRLVELMERAGLRARFLSPGLSTRRGLLVGQKRAGATEGSRARFAGSRARIVRPDRSRP